jgi:NAD(P)-dependent dehydrogenase (short-subunit alcohol dehydrogenase family)
MDLRALLARTTDVVLEGTVAGSFSRLGYEARRRLEHWDPPPEGALDGRRILLTGATSGLGRAAAATLLELGAEVVLVGRDEQKTIKVEAELSVAHPDSTVSAHIADLASLADVRKLADDLLHVGRPLDAVVHNAGALLPDKTMTVDGLETTLAVQVVAPHLLTRLLTPLLRAPARILWMTSGGMYAQGLDVEHLEMPEDGYKGATQYAKAKRAQVELLPLWAERLEPDAVVHAVHPGWADTPGVEQGLPGFRNLTRPILRTPDQGADTLVWLLWADEPLRTTGDLWHDRRRRSTTRLPGTGTHDGERQRLWQWVEDAVARATAAPV